jgi:hypothetical protein
MLLAFAGPVFAAAAADQNAMWKFGASSPDGLRFFQTAEYVGPEAVGTNEVERLSTNEIPKADSARMMIHTGYNRTNGTKFAAGYYRGPFYSTTSSDPKSRIQDTIVISMVSIFSSADDKKLVVAVDGGAVFSSTNSGLNWQVFSQPGRYEFPICTAPDGSGFYAEITRVGKGSSVATRADKALSNPPDMDWYVLGQGQKGTRLVLTSSASYAAPPLSITPSHHGVIVSWDLAFKGYVLQQNNAIASTNWVDVAIPVETTNDRNTVVISPAGSGNFYRLRKL